MSEAVHDGLASADKARIYTGDDERELLEVALSKNKAAVTVFVTCGNWACSGYLWFERESDY